MRSSPDVFVTRDARDQGVELSKAHARLVVEVLSEATAGFDRSRKFQCYRLLENLHEYVVIDAEARLVDVFRRDARGHWVLFPYEGEATAEFASLVFQAPLEAIFEDVPSSATEPSSHQPPDAAATPAPIP